LYDYYRSEAAYCEDMALATFEFGQSDEWLRLAEAWLALIPQEAARPPFLSIPVRPKPAFAF